MPGLVRHVVVVVLMAGLISCLPLEAEVRHHSTEGAYLPCPPGSYLSSGSCAKCDSGSYTKEWNRELSCHPCFKDCQEEFNMQVVKPCTIISNLKCRCMDGFECIKFDGEECSQCEPKPPSSKRAPSTRASSTRAPSTQAPSTRAPSTQGISTTASSAVPQSQEPHSKNIWIFIVVVLGMLAGITTMCYLCRPSEIDCFKRWVKRCSIANQKEDNNTASSEIKKTLSQESYQHADASPSTNSDCPAHQPASTEQPLPTAGNLGPLHIYGAGTVFVSLLNQFGLNGGDKEEECLQRQHEHELHSPTSPTFPLSTEERNRDSGFISFPSQEQGKECHMSKEEGL